MNLTYPHSSTALQTLPLEENFEYSIESVSELAQIPRHLIAVYCRYQLIAPIAPPEQEGWRFDSEAIRRLRRLERLRQDFRLNLQGVRLVAHLLDELEVLRDEVRLLRRR